MKPALFFRPNLPPGDRNRPIAAGSARIPSTRRQFLCAATVCFKSPDRPSCRADGLKAADPRHRPLDPEMVALDPLLQVLGDVMQRILRPARDTKPLYGGRTGR